MIQEIPPTKGYNVKSELKIFEENPSLFLKALTNLPPNSHEMALTEMPDVESVRSIIKQIIEKIIEKLNDDACLPETEYQSLLTDINQMAFDQIQENARLGRVATEDEIAERESDFIRSLVPSQEASQSRQNTWISTAAHIANHSRTSCDRCLNNNCTERK